jgi:ATP/maltotriose-dependent transcriptional regulator MalT
MYWFNRSDFREGLEWSERALALDKPVSLELRTSSVFVAGSVAHHHGDYAAARRRGEELMSISTEIQSEHTAAVAHFLLSYVASSERDYAQAVFHARAARDSFLRLDETNWIPFASNRLAMELVNAGDRIEADKLLHIALDLWREVGYATGVAMALSNMASLASVLGEFERALTLQQQGLTIHHELADRWQSAEGLIVIMSILAARGWSSLAARLLGAADSLTRVIGFTPYGPSRGEYERTVPILRETLGETGFAEAWAAGQRLSYDEAVAEALAIRLDETTAHSAPSKPADALTAREMDVLRLVVAGRSQPEIAEALSSAGRPPGPTSPTSSASSASAAEPRPRTTPTATGSWRHHPASLRNDTPAYATCVDATVLETDRRSASRSMCSRSSPFSIETCPMATTPERRAPRSGADHHDPEQPSSSWPPSATTSSPPRSSPPAVPASAWTRRPLRSRPSSPPASRSARG